MTVKVEYSTVNSGEVERLRTLLTASQNFNIYFLNLKIVGSGAQYNSTHL